MTTTARLQGFDDCCQPRCAHAGGAKQSAMRSICTSQQCRREMHLLSTQFFGGATLSNLPCIAATMNQCLFIRLYSLPKKCKPSISSICNVNLQLIHHPLIQQEPLGPRANPTGSQENPRPSQPNEDSARNQCRTPHQ